MSGLRLLVVEDDAGLRQALADTLMLAGIEVDLAASGDAAEAMVLATTYAMVVSDINMPGRDGWSLLRRLRQIDPGLPVLMMTAYASIAAAVDALQEGAVDYLAKPFTPDTLMTRVLQYARRSPGGQEPVASSASTQRLLAMARKVAEADVSVLITGESGTGKEVMARYIHRRSARADRPFVAINCAAIPENMLESMLFGYEKGAFTGAYTTQAGKFEQAQGGTLLLDEISEMALPLQAKLLRVLQEREVERLGGRHPIALDIRVLATSNRYLAEEIAQGRFREDLFYRLNVFPLQCTPLRERRDDIPELTEYFIAEHAQRYQPLPRLSADAIACLCRHDWPGNVRELSNVVQRALVLHVGGVIHAEDIVFDTLGARLRAPEVQPAHDLHSDVQQREFELIAQVLGQVASKKVAAQRLGISDRTLRYKLSQMREQGYAV